MTLRLPVWCWVICFCLNAALDASAQQLDDRSYRLAAGDRLRITVYGEPDLSGEFRLGADGELALPLIDRFRADGLRVTELEAALRSRLADGFLIHPRVSVEILTYRKVYVSGEVRKPGSFPYEPGLTVLRAVAVAGGLTAYGEDAFVWLNRGGNQPRSRKAGPSERVEPGDVITVPED